MDEIRRLADAVLYEGHVLWPYRRSSLKNRQRWTFGGVYPAAYASTTADRSVVRTEVLLQAAEPQLEVEVRFLQAVHRQVVVDGEPVDELPGHLTWDETVERTIAAPATIEIDAAGAVERVEGGELHRTWQELRGRVEVETVELEPGLHRVAVVIANESDWPSSERDEAIRRTFLSAHAVIRATNGELASATDPPAELGAETAALVQDGLWPVLVGEERTRDVVLAAPIILSDYARVAPESPGDFFDGGEIDQMLVLNILGLTDAEKAELRAGDPRAREVLERTEAMTPAETARLNGTIRDLRPVERR